MTTTATRTLAELRAAWDAPFHADPSDEEANAARGQLTRDLAAAILAADLWDRETVERTKVGSLYLSGAGWSREANARADAAGLAGSPEWYAALGSHEYVILSGDGYSAFRDHWCYHVAGGDVPVEEWVRYEYWTERGCEAHGFVHADIRCRRLLQAG